MVRTKVGIAPLAAASAVVWAQTAAPLSFEVASVKPAAPQGNGLVARRLSGGPGTADPGTLNFFNATLKLLVMRAYDLKTYQVEGPGWMDSLGYDILAKVPPGATAEQVRQMLRTLLAERFKLKIHRETRQLPVYALVVAKGGPKLREVKAPAIPEGAAAGPGGPPSGYVSLPRPGGEPPRMASGPGTRMMVTPNGRQLAGYMTMAGLANALTNVLDRAVVDQTELKATYDVNITWSPDELDRMPDNMAIGLAGGPGGGDPPHASAELGATLPQALEETLGLKLEPRKTEAEMLIIDGAEKMPVEN